MTEYTILQNVIFAFFQSFGQHFIILLITSFIFTIFLAIIWIVKK